MFSPEYLSVLLTAMKFRILFLSGPFKPILQVRKWGKKISFPKVKTIQEIWMSRLCHCSFQVLWSLYKIVYLLHIADAFLFGSSQYSALLQDQAPIISCCCAIENLEHLHAIFFTLFHGITLTIRSFIYLCFYFLTSVIKTVAFWSCFCQSAWACSQLFCVKVSVFTLLILPKCRVSVNIWTVVQFSWLGAW